MSEVADRRYSVAEELANSLTHAFGLMLAVAGLVLLIVETRRGDAREIVSCQSRTLPKPVSQGDNS